MLGTNSSCISTYFRRGIEILAGFIVFGVILILVGLLFDRIVLLFAVGHYRTVSIPDLRGMDLKTADSLCKTLGFELQANRHRVETKLPPASVLDQYPLAGRISKPGRTIEAVISVRDTLATCPNFVGRSPREAILIAKSANLIIRNDDIKYVFNDTIPVGVVINQVPNAGESVIRNGRVNIAVSLGPPKEMMIAPDLIGRQLDDAKMVLSQNGMVLGEVSHFPDKNNLPGTILAQNPQSGEAVAFRSPMHLRVAIQPKNIRTLSAEEEPQEE